MLKHIEKVAQTFHTITYNKQEEQQKHRETTSLEATSGTSNLLFTK